MNLIQRENIQRWPKDTWFLNGAHESPSRNKPTPNTPESEPDDEEASFNTNKDNENIAKYEEEEGHTEAE